MFSLANTYLHFLSSRVASVVLVMVFLLIREYNDVGPRRKRLSSLRTLVAKSNAGNGKRRDPIRENLD
jgi:hypothetical protein